MPKPVKMAAAPEASDSLSPKTASDPPVNKILASGNLRARLAVSISRSPASLTAAARRLAVTDMS